jgi:hypothetical protein
MKRRVGDGAKKPRRPESKPDIHEAAGRHNNSLEEPPRGQAVTTAAEAVVQCMRRGTRGALHEYAWDEFKAEMIRLVDEFGEDFVYDHACTQLGELDGVPCRDGSCAILFRCFAYYRELHQGGTSATKCTTRHADDTSEARKRGTRCPLIYLVSNPSTNRNTSIMCRMPWRPSYGIFYIGRKRSPGFEPLLRWEDPPLKGFRNPLSPNLGGKLPNARRSKWQGIWCG